MSKTIVPGRDHRPIDPAERSQSFTVHLRGDTSQRLVGRLTHVATGASAYFESAEELVIELERLRRSG